MTWVLLMVALLVAVAPGAEAKRVVGEGRQARIAGQLVVSPRPGVSPDAVAAVLASNGVRAAAVVEPIGATVVAVDEAALSRVERRLRRSGLFRRVERDYTVRVADLPNDPYLPAQWGVLRILAPEAWALSLGAEVVVAVIDTGVDATHPDLLGQVLDGYDFVNEDADPADDHGHGTRMSGIVAALHDNGEGVAGIAPQARLLPVKVLDADGYGAYSDVARGIIYAVDRGAQVLNLSLAGATESTVLQDAVDYAAARDAVVVAAAGNAGSSEPMYPAAAPGAVAVSASDAFDTRAGFSSFGNWIDVAAPGVDIVTTSVDHGYASSGGTSPAAAFVSGTFALLRSAEPSLSGSAAEARVFGGAIDLGPVGRDASFGWGLVDAYGALVPGHDPPGPDLAAPEVHIVRPLDGSLLSGTTTVVVAAGDDVAVARVELYLDDGWVGMATSAPYEIALDAAALAPGTHRLRAIAYDTAGRAARSASVRVLTTPGSGLLVSRAVVSPTVVRIVGTFAFPEGLDLDPASDALAMAVSSAPGMVLALSIEPGAMDPPRGRTFQAVVRPEVPVAGTVRVRATRGRAPGVFSIRIRATQLAAMTMPSEVLQVGLQVGGCEMTHAVAVRASGAAQRYP